MRRPLDLLYNFHWVLPGHAARSAQAYLGFLAPFLRSNGIRAVINLRGPNPGWRWWREEKRICAAMGIRHFDSMLSSKRLPTPGMLRNLLDAFDAAPAPLLLKCSGGQDRTSLAAGLYLIHQRGWGAYDAAMAQFSFWPHLHMPRRNQTWLAQFPAFARDAAGGRDLRDWIVDGYRWENFRLWLEAQGKGDSFAGVYEGEPQLT